MKVSVVMIDGGFRENIYSAEYFSKQDFPDDEYEVIWVEYYDKANEDVRKIGGVNVIELGRTGTYHSSYCFNAGIKAARGDILVIPDADQIVGKNFLARVCYNHDRVKDLVCYGFRFDEMKKDALSNHSMDELREKCRLRNPYNYGGCLTVSKENMLRINGYEQHKVFESGFHANGLDVYTRFKSLGLPIMWDRELVLYHPWHVSTLADAREYEAQKKLIAWRSTKLQYMALFGIDESRNEYEKYSSELEMLLPVSENVYPETGGDKQAGETSILDKLKSMIAQ